MWPQTLQMSDDECRSVLRRLELESYSNIIGVFRAQGVLSEKKMKLLEELRSVFHITQERHRAEARRVANDEYLSTIAKAVSGPNTWQDWSREGRRSLPMLPRVDPQTALGWIANNLATEVAKENAKLPFPAETGTAALEEQTAMQISNASREAAGVRHPDRFVVTADPFKMPDIPAVGVKRNLKRNIYDGHTSNGAGAKKRSINDNMTANKHKHITATTNTSPTSSRKSISQNIIQQQRFFYQQQQRAKKLAKAANKREKSASTSTGKIGRKSKKIKEQELREQQQHEREQQHYQQQQQDEYTDGLLENSKIGQRVDHADYQTSTNIANAMLDMANYGHHYQHQQQHTDFESPYVSSEKPPYMPLPQIASSKRDITRNLTKLQMPAQIATVSNAKIDSQVLSSKTVPSPSTLIVGAKSVPEGKVTPFSTPVQKYIVEDRQPLVTSGQQLPSAAASITSSTSPSQYITSLPHISNITKLRSPTVSTVLSPGTKLSTPTKKLTGATVLPPTAVSPGGTSASLVDNSIGNANNAAQLFSIVDNTSANITNISSVPQQQQHHILNTPTAPTHAPPAVLQLHNNEVVRVGAGGMQASTSTTSQSKVLSTKILPIVLSGNSTSSSSMSKSDVLKNGSNSIVSVSSANFASNSPGTTIIKSLPASLIVSGQGHSSNSPGSSNAVFSNFNPSGTLYRKPPNILKSSSATVARNSAAKGSGPQIISNIRLTPAIASTSGSSSTFGLQQTQSNIFQQQLRTAPSTSTGIRTSVKICQSPNGKVFIQPANVDPSKLGKLSTGQITQRLIPGTILGNTNSLSVSGSVNSGTIGSPNKPMSPHRIAIQKVQIIPAPLSGTAMNSLQQTQQKLTATLALGANKNNLGTSIFMSSGANSRTSPASGTITLTKASFTTTSSAISTSKQNEMAIKPSNVVVIDAGGNVNKLLPQHAKITTLPVTTNLSSQMITEDTPVDIIVDSTDENPLPASENSSITAVLASNLIENSTSSAQQNQKQQQQQQTTSTKVVPIAVLNATDWEMELDQATAANSLQTKPQQQQQQQNEQIETAETIIIDDSFEDVIIEEEEPDTVTTESENYDSEDQQQHHQHQQQEGLNELENNVNIHKDETNHEKNTETNYDNVPMCIEESIETTTIEHGKSRYFTDNVIGSTSEDDINSDVDDRSDENTIEEIKEHCFDENFESDKQELLLETTDDKHLYNNHEENLGVDTNLSTTKFTTHTEETTVDTNTILEKESIQKENKKNVKVFETQPSTTISASLVTVTDYDDLNSDSNLEDAPNQQATFDITDDTQSKQNDVFNAHKMEE